MSKNVGAGYLCATISVFGFGSNYVPVKQYDMGDGMFFQLQQALGIFFVGVIVQVVQGYHSTFQPFAMFGGFLWCTGNCMSTLIIKFVGLSLGLLIWGACNMMTGWLMGMYGLFGTVKDEPPVNPAMNIAGVLTALLGTSIYFFVNPDIEKTETKGKDLDGWTALSDENEISIKTDPKKVGLLKAPSSDEDIFSNNHDQVPNEEYMPRTTWVDNLSLKQRRAAGIIMAMVAGVLFGSNFAPSISLMDDQTTVNGKGLHNSARGLDYVFSHFTGILITSLMWFLVYCVVNKNKPWISGDVIIPGCLSGVIWGVSQACWFVANENLGVTTAYPIITTGPGIVASLWGVVVFREIKGKRNLYMLMLAFFISFIAIMLICLSKVEFSQSK